MNPKENSSEVFLLSSYKEKVVLHLPTELDGLHLSAMMLSYVAAFLAIVPAKLRKVEGKAKFI